MTWADAGMVLAGVALLGAAVAALPSIFRGVLGVFRGVRAAAKAPTTIAAMWSEFDTNGGGTLRAGVDRAVAASESNEAAITGLHDGQQTNQDWQTAHAAADEARFDSIAFLIDERTQVTPSNTSEPQPISVYTQTRFHDVINRLTVLIGRESIIDHRLTKIEQHLDIDDIPAVIDTPPLKADGG